MLNAFRELGAVNVLTDYKDIESAKSAFRGLWLYETLSWVTHAELLRCTYALLAGGVYSALSAEEDLARLSVDQREKFWTQILSKDERETSVIMDGHLYSRDGPVLGPRETEDCHMPLVEPSVPEPAAK